MSGRKSVMTQKVGKGGHEAIGLTALEFENERRVRKKIWRKGELKRGCGEGGEE